VHDHIVTVVVESHTKQFVEVSLIFGGKNKSDSGMGKVAAIKGTGKTTRTCPMTDSSDECSSSPIGS